MVEDTEINNIVDAGREEVRNFLRAYIGRSLNSTDIPERLAAQKVLSRLALSLNKARPMIDVQRIRLLIIEENAEALQHVKDDDPRLLRLFALATGRAVQTHEYLAALGRISKTYTEPDEHVPRYLDQLIDLLVKVERASVRMFEEDEISLSISRLHLAEGDKSEGTSQEQTLPVF